jgi:hypothetical protein
MEVCVAVYLKTGCRPRAKAKVHKAINDLEASSKVSEHFHKYT